MRQRMQGRAAVWRAASLCSGALIALGSVAAGPAIAAAASGSASADPVAAKAASEVDASTPYTLVKTAANAMLEALDAHRDEYRHDPAKLRALIDQTLLPHFDSS